MDHVRSISDFSKKLIDTLDHIEYRRVETAEDFETIARLRYKAYKTKDVLPLLEGSMLDEIDFDTQAYVFGVYYYEELISTIRVHHVTPGHRVCQTISIFPDAITDLLDAGATLIDPARFAVDPDVAGDMPWIPYLTLRPNIMAAKHFRGDYVLQHVRPAHAAFYRRVFRAETIVGPTMADTYGFDLTLLGTKSRDVGRNLLERYPFFDSLPCERKLMFDRQSRPGGTPLTIVPTARYAPAFTTGDASVSALDCNTDRT